MNQAIDINIQSQISNSKPKQEVERIGHNLVIEAFWENYQTFFNTPFVMRIEYPDEQITSYNIDMKWVLDAKEVLALRLTVVGDRITEGDHSHIILSFKSYFTSQVLVHISEESFEFDSSEVISNLTKESRIKY